VLAGRIRFELQRGMAGWILPGMGFQTLPGTSHRMVVDRNEVFHDVYVVVDQVTARALMQSRLLSGRRVWQLGDPEYCAEQFEELVRRLRQPVYEMPDAAALAYVIQWMQGLYARHRALEFPGREGDAVRAACRLLEERGNAWVPLETIARKVGLSYAVFRREFRRLTGQSPGHYRIQRRLEEARGLLAMMSVKEVAEVLGYPDPYTFSDQYKRFMGVPPSKHGRRGRGEPG